MQCKFMYLPPPALGDELGLAGTLLPPVDAAGATLTVGAAVSDRVARPRSLPGRP